MRLHTSVKRDEAAMTWAEIAEALGYGTTESGRKAVFMAYQNAIKKIRKRPEAIKALKELVDFRNRQRNEANSLPDWEM